MSDTSPQETPGMEAVTPETTTAATAASREGEAREFPAPPEAHQIAPDMPDVHLRGTGGNHPTQGPTWHAAAGRKGAERIHQLIQEGTLYEQEHGLKRGRQRIRQLIQEGKLYEQEHGLKHTGRSPGSRRPPRMSSQQSLTHFLNSLARIVRPAFRPHIARMIQALEQEGQ